MTQLPSETSAHPSARVEGWKQIGNYFQRGPRTVQRWERALGMPVHRMNTGRAEVVYAFADELDAWRKGASGGALPADTDTDSTNTEASPAAPSWWRRCRWLGAGALAIVATIATHVMVARLAAPAVGGTPASRATVKPAEAVSWEVESDTLRTFDARGRLVWEHTFDKPQYRPEAPNPYKRTDAAKASVIIDDLDGDRLHELLFLSGLDEPTGSGVMCFGPDGMLRWSFEVARTFRFGSGRYAPPWRSNRVFVTVNSDSQRSIWFVATAGNMDYPSLLTRLDPRGHVTGEFLSDGYVAIVTVARIARRDLVLVGAVNNERKGASLAVLDAGNPTGTAPAAAPYYSCLDGCPPGRPLHFLVFPALDICATGGIYPAPNWITTDAEGVSVIQLIQEGPGQLSESERYAASSRYWLDRDFHVTRAELGERFGQVHRSLEEMGILKHPFGTRDEQDLWPVLRWDGRTFAKIGRVEMTR